MFLFYLIYGIEMGQRAEKAQRNKMAYFKYRNVADLLRQRILADGVYENGDKLPTETELCEEFKVSRRTIRTALACLESEGLLHSMQGSGVYVTIKDPAGLVVSTQNGSKNIAVMLTDVESYIYPALLRGINNELIEGEHSLTLRITSNSIFKEARVIESLLNSPVDAVILDPARGALTNVNKPLYKKLASKFPCVSIHTRLEGVDIPAITMTDTTCFIEMTKYVLAKGHKALAGIFCYDEVTSINRFKGMIQVARGAGICLEEKNILWVSRAQCMQPEMGPLVDVFMENNKDRTAFVCCNDSLASALISRLKQNGLSVPDNVSVTGFDDAPSFGTGITTMAHPQEEMGIKAARAALELLRNPKAIVDYEFSPKIIDKGSVACIKR